MSETIVDAIETLRSIGELMAADLPEDPTPEDLQDQAIAAALVATSVALLDTFGRIAVALEALAPGVDLVHPDGTRTRV